MKKDYLSREEDERFSKTVIDFNSSGIDANEKLKHEIRERTKLLIYIVSRDILHLSYDDASSIFLEMEEELDKIIASYKVSNATFNQYLKQLCQYRCRRMKHKKYHNTLWENAFFMEEAKYNARFPDDVEFLEIQKREKPESLTINEDIYSEFDIKGIFDFISRHKNVPDYPIYNKMEVKLRKSLETTAARKRFLIFILTLPRKSEGFDSYDIARVMQTDELAINRFLALKDEALGFQEEKIREIQSRASKHWRIMAKLIANINMENDEEKKRKLRDHYQTQVVCHKNNMKEIKKASCGMSRTSIATSLEVSRSSVSIAIKETSTLLEIIAKS